MKTNVAVKNALRTSTVVNAIPRLIAEFNHNRYSSPTAENTPSAASNSRDPDVMPIESIIGAQRPRRGSLKANVDDILVLPSYNPVPPAARFHVADANDYYKYWSSPSESSSSGVIANDANPQVTYATQVLANKIVIGLENSVSSPINYKIYLQTTVGGAWTQVADETTTDIDNDGRITLYRQKTSWGTTRRLDYHTKIAGIKLTVTKMDKAVQYVEVIEIAALLEKDLSPWLQEVDCTQDLGDTNAVLPLGRISANIGTLTLFNGLVDEEDYTKGLVFNNDNEDSIFYNLLRENVKFTLDYIYDVAPDEPVRDFTMYSEQDWSGDLEETISISVRDSAKFLQEIDCPETFYQTDGVLTVGEVVWRLLDSVGFVDYHIDVSDTTGPVTMDFFWCDNSQKIWDILSSLAEGTQTAIYFDSYGILQIKNKETAFNESATPVWHIRGENSGTEEADLISSQLERKEIGNSITLTYKPTDFKRTANNNYLNELMWEPEIQPVILRSSDLQQSMGYSDNYFRILAIEAQDWPFTGYVQIEGELIAYSAKEFTYFDSTNNTTNTLWLSSIDDYQFYNNKADVNAQYLNRFTGKMKISERGMWDTEPALHVVDPYAYKVYKFINGINTPKPAGIFHYYGTESSMINGVSKSENQGAVVRLQTDDSWNGDDWGHASFDGSSLGDAPQYYGTRFRYLNNSDDYNLGGLHISGDQATGRGYFIEFRANTDATTAIQAMRVYSKNTSGDITQHSGEGIAFEFVEGKWYNLDVQFANDATNHYIWLWIDGRYMGLVTIDSDQRLGTDCFGFFVRGDSCFEFDYLYAFDAFDTATDVARWGEDISHWDRIQNAYVSNQIGAEFTHQTYTGLNNSQRRFNTRFYDEFAPVVHEMRKFDVNFSDKLPGDQVNFLATNEATARYLEVYTSPWHASFFAVNASHNDVEIAGENESLGIYCRNVSQGEEKTLIFQDDDSVRASGKKEIGFTSDWIQSESAATVLGNWITSHWDNKTDEMSVTIFGNPLLQLTDTVYLTDPQQDKVAEKYFILSIQNNFSQGIETTLRLRKVKV